MVPYVPLAKLAAVFLVLAAAAPAAAEGEAARGKRVFNKCKACHLLEDTGKKKIGPHLAGIFGRKAGSIAGFRYSKAMNKADIVWDDKTIDAYIAAPRKFLKGNKMAFAGVRKAKDRADVIAYLKEATR
ncbi:MAG: cytochrome c family protein [Alphaproteobacteria bacterium]|nr:cytochrome c family protein [Alphaproteobacteria bacterium]